MMAGEQWIERSSQCDVCKRFPLCKYPDLFKNAVRAAMETIASSNEETQQLFNSSSMCIGIKCRYFEQTERSKIEEQRRKMMEESRCFTQHQ